MAEFESSSSGKKKPFASLLEVAGLIFLAEWGDRSMLATIALGAAQVGAARRLAWVFDLVICNSTVGRVHASCCVRSVVLYFKFRGPPRTWRKL